MRNFYDLTTAGLLGVTVCIGCTDRLSGPEAVQLVDALEQALSPGAARRQRQFWERMGFLGRESDWLRLRPTSTVVLHADGQPLTYRAVVFERVMVPSSGLDTTGCAGTRWTVYLWRDGDSPDGLTFSGGQFHQRLSGRAQQNCPGVHLVRPEPWLLAFSPDQNTLLGTDGDGDISPGMVTGECAFLAPEDAGFLREARGITCELTHHRVRFHAQVRQVSRTLPSGELVFESSSSRLELSPTEVTGFRYTIHCDGSTRMFRYCAPPLGKGPPLHEQLAP